MLVQGGGGSVLSAKRSSTPDAVNTVNVGTGGVEDTVNGCCEHCEFLVQDGEDAVNGHCECSECCGFLV